MANFFERMIVGPFNAFLEKLVNFLPNLLSALFIFVAGVVLGLLVRFLLLRIFRVIGLDRFSDRSGIVAALRRAGIREPSSLILAQLFLWLVVISFSIFALRSLNITALEHMFERFVLYLPSVFVAAIILVFGFLLSNFLGRAVLIAAVNAGLKVSNLVARLVKLTVFVLAVTMALEQLGIGKGAITVAFAIVFGGIVLALAIAFGLGGRDIAKEYLEKKIKGESEKDRIEHL